MLKVALAEMPPHVMLGAGTPPAGASAGCPPGRRLHLGYLAAKTAATGTTANGQGPLRDLGGGDPLSLSAAPAAPPIGRKDSPMLSKKWANLKLWGGTSQLGTSRPALSPLARGDTDATDDVATASTIPPGNEMAQRSGGSAGSQPGSQPGKAHAGSLSNRLKGWGQRKGKGRSTPGLIPWDQFAGGNPKSVKPDTPAPASPAPASPADDDEPGAVAADAAAGSGTGTGTGGASHTAVVAATSSLRFWRSSKGKHTAADVANGNAAAAAAEGSAAADTDLDADQADTAVAGSSSHAAAVGATPRFWRSTKGKQPAPDAELLEMLQAERVRFVAEGFGDGILISTLQGIRCTSMRCDTASGDGPAVGHHRIHSSQDLPGYDLVLGRLDHRENLLEIAELDALADLEVCWEWCAAGQLGQLPGSTPMPATAATAAKKVDVIEQTFHHVSTMLTPALVAEIAAVFVFAITHSGGAPGLVRSVTRWTLDLKNGHGAVFEGTSEATAADAEIALSRVAMLRLLDRSIDPMMAVLLGEVKVTGDTMVALKLSSLQPILNRARVHIAKAAASPCTVDSGAKDGLAPAGGGGKCDGKRFDETAETETAETETLLSPHGHGGDFHHGRDRMDSASNASDDGADGGLSDSDDSDDDVLLLQFDRTGGDGDGRRTKATRSMSRSWAADGAVLPTELNLLDVGAMEAIGFDCGQCIPQAWIDDDDDDVSIGQAM